MLFFYSLDRWREKFDKNIVTMRLSVANTTKSWIIQEDTILKNFWKNNERFADLFNTFLFNGEEILKPYDLTEVDTDVSSMLKFNGHPETVQKILDVVKKTAYGITLWF